MNVFTSYQDVKFAIADGIIVYWESQRDWIQKRMWTIGMINGYYEFK